MDLRKFLLHSILWAVLLLGSFAAVYLSVNEKSDPFYFKLTSLKQTSLIIGSSLAGIDINPAILKEAGVDFPIYNYAFAAPLSPYGPSYLRAIKGKLAPSTKDGIFIITVEPLSISSDAPDPNDTLQFEERELFLGQLSSFSSNPNFEYLIHHYKEYNIKLLWNKSTAKMHDDGWLEVDFPRQKWEAAQQSHDGDYEYKLGLYQFSETRLSYLKKTIAYLQNYGKLYLVRLPNNEAHIALEKEYMPDFENILAQISKQFDIPYLSMAANASDFEYYDGVHVCKESSVEVSKIIADFIIKNQ